MTDLDREVAEKATRLERESKELLKLAEKTRKNVKQAFYRGWLWQTAWLRRN